MAKAIWCSRIDARGSPTGRSTKHAVTRLPSRVASSGVIDADGHHRADGCRTVDRFAAREQPGPQRSRDRCEDNVIDRHVVGVAAEGEPVADLAIVLQVGSDHDVAPVSY